ncbi:MAG: hypothetical protein JO053_13925, partial [Acidobacteria bacterium]|nr:hypothetical protein [Acidobacteriota bacterium]
SIVPQLVRKNITDLRWTATKTDQGYEDKWQIVMPPERAELFEKDMAAHPGEKSYRFSNVPDVDSVTFYNFDDPARAWQTFLGSQTANLTDPQAKVMKILPTALLEPYGIADIKGFLQSLRPGILTGHALMEGDQFFVSADIANADRLKKSMVPMQLKSPAEGIRIYEDSDNSVAAVYPGNTFLVSGSPAGVGLWSQGEPDIPASWVTKLGDTTAPVTSIGKEIQTAPDVAEMLSEKKTENASATTTYYSETRFTKTGIERKTTSDLGFLGWMIAQLAEE